MARFVGDASWQCCYPDACPCDCCCQGGDCSAPCTGTICGVGACCTCNSGNWSYAWKTNCPWCCNAGLYPALGCGVQLFIGKPDGSAWFQAPRVDTGPSACPMIDLSKPLFLQFAPLSQGIVQNVIACTDAPAC